jgi:aerobic-type carbon monoxide dehydrogenase small subunit (CoxS/CutS family)
MTDTAASSVEFVARRGIRLKVNGVSKSVLVSPDRRLLSVLRDELGLTGTKTGCEVGVCGACTVLVNGQPTSSCILLAVQAEDADVLTVEGLDRDERFRLLQQAFIDEGGFQCGYCTSGQLMTIASMVLSGSLPSMSDDDIRETMLGNLCRCTGYYGILRAIEKLRSAL